MNEYSALPIVGDALLDLYDWSAPEWNERKTLSEIAQELNAVCPKIVLPHRLSVLRTLLPLITGQDKPLRTTRKGKSIRAWRMPPRKLSEVSE